MDEKSDALNRLASNPSREAIAAFVEEALLTEDVSTIVQALAAAVHAKGATSISDQVGLSLQQLEKSFDPNGDPTVSELAVVMQALGIRFSVSSRN